MAKNQNTPELGEQNAPETKSTFTQADLVNEGRKIQDKLDAQPKVRIRLALPEGVTPKEAEEGKTDYSETVMVNGHITRIKRGYWVEVPKTIADILEEAGKI